MRTFVAGLALFALLCAPPRSARAEALRESLSLERAEQAIARGRYDEALTSLAPLVRRQQPRALAIAGRIHALRGEREPSAERYRAVVALAQRGAIGARDGEALWALAEATAALGAYRDANETFARAAQASPQRAEIELAWADLFLAKHATREAEACVARVLAAQPDHPRALERMARIELERGVSFASVEARLARALEREPALTAAHVTRAGIALRDEDLEAAEAHLARALSGNPHDLEALSVHAAVRFVADDAAGFERAVARVLAENPHFSRLYTIVASYADWEHRYPELVALSDAALALDPEDAHAHALRGINLLRIGSEEGGLAALREAWARDRYDEQVYNLLELYERVIARDYETLGTPSFTVRLPKRERALLAPYALPLLHEAEATLRARYAFTPSAPTHVELYGVKEQFAIRATGLPQLGIQGICFGNTVITLSPSAAEINWGQVLYHELSHVFHVQLSRGRVPRWFTEGLAEVDSGRARPEWKREDERMLYDALATGQLPRLAELNRAFSHAARPEELAVAYYASTQAVAYVVERFGFVAVRRMLAAWGEGRTSERVFSEVLGVSLAALDADFRALLTARLSARYARDLRIDIARYRDLDYWRRRSAAPKARSEDHAGLALALALSGEREVARERARALLAEVPDEPLAHFTLAHVALEQGDLPGAARALDALLAHGRDGYQLRMLRARIDVACADPRAAMSSLEVATRLDPTRTEAYTLQLELAERLGDAAQLEAAARQLSALDQHGRAPTLKLLALLRRRGAYPELIERARGALYRDVHAPEIHLALADGLLHTGALNEAHTEAERGLSLARGPLRAEASALLRAIEAALAAARRGAARSASPPSIEASATDSR